MAGLLKYGKDFEGDHYKGGDGLPHYEIVAVDGDFYTISNSSWDVLAGICSSHGISTEVWPVYESAIDAPIDEVRNKNQPLKQAVASIPDNVVRSNLWLEKIVNRIKEGMLVVYCRV